MVVIDRRDVGGRKSVGVMGVARGSARARGRRDRASRGMLSRIVSYASLCVC